MNFNLVDELAKATHLVEVLKAAGYTECAIVGGALRVLALGGDTQDVDIAVICDDIEDYNNLAIDVNILLSRIAHAPFDHMHDKSGYGSTDGFLGDWRSGVINIVAYKKSDYFNLMELVNRFDLNINQWYLDNDGDLRNDFYDPDTGVVEINPLRDGEYKLERLTDRIERFRKTYPELDWTKVNARRKVNKLFGMESISYA